MREQELPGFNDPKPNAPTRLLLVNEIRHIRMDGIKFDSKDDSQYFGVYDSVMSSISADYPLLQGEVQRQMAKKMRRLVRKRGSCGTEAG